MSTYNKYINDINAILRRRNEISKEIESQSNVIMGLIEEMKKDGLSDEIKEVNINNIAVFSNVLCFYEQRLLYLDNLISEYSTLLMSRNNIESDSYSKIIKEFDKRKDYLLGPVEFDTKDTKKRHF